MAKLSYFAEQRGGNGGVNFFNKIDIGEIRRNVRRIIKDIKYDNIKEQDYMYFHNNKILQACIDECWENYITNSTINNALLMYINEYLSKGFIMYPSLDRARETRIVCDQQKLFNMRQMCWHSIWQMFMMVSYGADIITALSGIKAFDSKDISNL